jgi:hypothetical protein
MAEGDDPAPETIDHPGLAAHMSIVPDRFPDGCLITIPIGSTDHNAEMPPLIPQGDEQGHSLQGSDSRAQLFQRASVGHRDIRLEVV